MPLHSESEEPARRSLPKQPKIRPHTYSKMEQPESYGLAAPAYAAGAYKFDGGLALPTSMFQSVADMISQRDVETPAPSYINNFANWKETVEDEITEILQAADVVLDSSEEQSFQVGKQVTFRALEKFVERAKTVGWSSQPPEVRKEAAEKILARPQIPQRTPAWYAQGKEVLTASEFGKLFGTPRCVSQLVASKIPTGQAPSSNRLACMTCEMGAFDWGVRFEPVVKQILEAKWGVKIAEAGRIVHPKDTHVAASPDGIYLAATDPARVGRLVEIKCPITRKIGEGVPFDYWCQMQVQMEVTGIGECDYVEVKLDSIQGSATDLSGAEGYVWLLQNPQTCEMRYAYTEAEMIEGWDVVEKIPWRVNGMYTVTVMRDMGWYENTAEMRRQFWKNVEEARKIPEKPKVIVTKEPAACMIVDT